MSDERLTTRDIAAAREPGRREAERVEDTRPRDAAAVEERESRGRDDVAHDERAAPMFADDEAAGYRTRWDAIQTGFVDEPRRAVEEADALVAQVMKRLGEGFAEERMALEGQWDRGGQVSTEDLRIALRRYRSFFQRLLSL
jgi:hypothetical protein